MRKDVGIERLPLRKITSNANNRLGPLDWVTFVILGLFTLMIIYPFYNAFLISLSPERVVLETPFLIYPKEITFDAYREVFNNKLLWSGFSVTMILLIVGTAYQLFFTVITGYA